MVYETINNRNQSEGLHVLFQYVNDVTNGLFGNMFLFSVFIIIAFGTYFSQRRLTGRGNFPSSFAVAGYITAITAILLYLIPNLIGIQTVVISIAISILGTVWIFFTRDS